MKSSIHASVQGTTQAARAGKWSAAVGGIARGGGILVGRTSKAGTEMAGGLVGEPTEHF